MISFLIRHKKIIMLSMFLVGLLSLTTVSAVENVTTDIVSVDENACEELDIQPGEAFENSKPIADLNNTINNNSESEISLDSNYMYRNSDSAFAC